jgi:hypothetical protein
MFVCVIYPFIFFDKCFILGRNDVLWESYLLTKQHWTNWRLPYSDIAHISYINPINIVNKQKMSLIPGTGGSGCDVLETGTCSTPQSQHSRLGPYQKLFRLGQEIPEHTLNGNIFRVVWSKVHTSKNLYWLLNIVVLNDNVTLTKWGSFSPAISFVRTLQYALQ